MDAIKKETAGTKRVRHVLDDMAREMKLSRHDNTVFFELSPQFTTRELLTLTAKLVMAELQPTPEIAASPEETLQR